MFGWFRKKGFSDHYQPSERLIYSFFDGKNTVRVDPLVLYKKLSGCGPELLIHLKLAKSISKDAAHGHDLAVAKVREVFSLPPFEDNGLSEMECLDLLNHFLAYCDAIKKKANRTPTSPTAMPPPIEPTSGGSPPTPNGSGSGSTEKGPSTEGPEPPPTESGSPSGS